MEKSIEDLVRRKILGEKILNEILPRLQENRLVHNYYEPSIDAIGVQFCNGELIFSGVSEPWVPERIDYLNDFR